MGTACGATARLVLCLLLVSCALDRPVKPTGSAAPDGDPPSCQEVVRQEDPPRFAVKRLTPATPMTPDSPLLGGRPFHLGVPKLQVDLPFPADPPANPPEPEAYHAELRRLIGAWWVYPEEARLRRESGRVTLRFELAKDGSVRCIGLVHSSGSAVLDRAAIEAIRGALLPPIPDALGDHFSMTANFRYVLDPARASPGF
jgi:TonB family protein